MESSSQSTISSHWSQSSGSHTAGDVRQIQALQSEVNHLRTMVNQLTNTIDIKDAQLQEALATSSTVNGLHEEITALKVQLREATVTAAQKEKSYKSQISDLNTKAEEEKSMYTKKNEAQTREIAKKNTLISELTEERDQLKEEFEDTKGQLKASIERLNKVSKQRSRGREKIKELEAQLAELTEKCSNLENTQEQLALENKDQASLIENLQSDLASAKKSLSEKNASLSAKTKEANNLQTALDTLSSQLECSKTEISYLNEERAKLLELVQKLNSTVYSYEDQVETLTNQNKTLIAKNKKASALAPQLLSDKFDFSQLNFPFQGELRKKIDHICSLDHFLPTQKVQLIINEASKAITTAESEREASKIKSETAADTVNEIRKKFQQTYDVLNSITREWKNLEFNEQKIDAVAFCESDKNFLEFLAEQCVKLENLPEAAEFLGPLFVPGEIFNDDHFEERKALVETVAETNKDLATIISAMFLINTRLKKQIIEILNGQSTKDEVAECLTQLGIDDFTLVPSIVEDLQARIAHLKSTRKEVHTALVSARDDIESKNKEECALRQQIERLKARINELNAEVAALKAERDIHKQFSHKTDNGLFSVPPTPQPEKSDSFASVPPSPQPQMQAQAKVQQPVVVQVQQPQCQQQVKVDCSEYKKQIKTLQKQLADKTRELEELKESANQAQADAAKELQEMTAKAQKSARNEQALEKEVKELQEELASAQEKLSKNRRKAKSVVNGLRKQHEAELNEIAVSKEAEANALKQTIGDTKAKMEKMCRMIQELRESLSESEQRRGEASEESERLRKQASSLEMKIAAVTEQFQREQKTYQATMAAKMLNNETQHQKDVKETKAKMEAEKQTVIDFFTRNLGALYGIIDLDYDEGAITHLFNRISQDLTKLKFFQEQATKI